MNLLIFPPAFGLASFDAESLTLWCCSKIYGVNIGYNSIGYKHWTNFGFFPCITEITNGDPIAIGYENSFGLLVQRAGLKDQGESSSTLKAINSESLALKYYVLDSLVPAVKAAMWFDAGLATALTQPYFIRCVRFPLNLVLVHQQSRRAELLLRERLATLSSYSPNELTLSTLQDEPVQQIQGMSTRALNKLTARGLRCFEDLSILLENSSSLFLCEDKPHEVDALVFGHLAPLLAVPETFTSGELASQLRTAPGLEPLRRYIARLRSLYPLEPALLERQVLTAHDKPLLAWWTTAHTGALLLVGTAILMAGFALRHGILPAPASPFATRS